MAISVHRPLPAHIAKIQEDMERRASDEGLDFFEKNIRPVLVKSCYKCHSADSKEVKGGLVLDTRDGIRPYCVGRSVK